MPILTPVHVVPLDGPTGRDHRASQTCWCGPVTSFRLLETGQPVYRHRTPPEPPGRDYHPLTTKDRALLALARFDAEPEP